MPLVSYQLRVNRYSDFHLDLIAHRHQSNSDCSEIRLSATTQIVSPLVCGDGVALFGPSC